MYGKNFTQGNKAQARRWRRSGINSSSRRFKQYSLPNTIRTSNKTAVRHRYAIQHLQQRRSIGFMALHERKAWVDILRFTSKSENRITGARIDSANSTGATTKQSELVRPHMVSTRQNSRAGSKRFSLASWNICKVAITNNSGETQSSSKYEKLSCPYIGYIDPPIYPYIGQMAIAIYPYIGLIRGLFQGFPYPYIGHLLDIPLYTALIGD